MGIVIKQGIINSIVTYIGIVVGAANLLYIFPKWLKPEEIGLIRVIIDIAIILAAFAQVGAGALTDKFFPYFRDKEKKHNGFLLLLLIYPFAGFVLITSLYLLSGNFWFHSYQEKSPLLLEFYYFVIPLTFFLLYQQLLEAYCRAHFKIVIPSFIREVYLRLFLIVALVLYYLKIIDLQIFITLLIISYAIATIALLFYIKYLKIFYIKSFNFSKNNSLKKEMIQFGLWVFLVGAFSHISTRFDVLFLSSISGLTNTGIYSIAFYIATVIEIPRRALSQISTPIISHFWKNNDLKNIENIYKKSSLNQLIVGFLLFLLIWGNVDFILRLLPNEEIYKTGKFVIMYIGLSRLFDMLMGVNTEVIANSPFYRFNFFSAIFSGIFTIVISYILINALGMDGAAISILLNVIVLNLLRGSYIYYKVKIQPFSLQTIYIACLGGLVYAIAYYLPLFHFQFQATIFNILIRSIIITCLFVGSVYYFKLSEDFNKICLKAVNLLGISNNKY